MNYPTSALVIENSQTFSMYLSLLLQRMGLKTLRISEPTAAKIVLERGFTDIVIIGDQENSQPLHLAVKKLSTSLAGRSIPIIVISKQDDPEERKACYEAGCQAFLLKPVQPKQLQDALYAGVIPEAERRQNLRCKVGMSAAVSIKGQAPGTLKIISLSQGGALIEYGASVPIGTQITLALSLDGIEVKPTGKVIYNLANSDGKGLRAFGVLFQDVPQWEAASIDQYLERILRLDCLNTEDSK